MVGRSEFQPAPWATLASSAPVHRTTSSPQPSTARIVHAWGDHAQGGEGSSRASQGPDGSDLSALFRTRGGKRILQSAENTERGDTEGKGRKELATEDSPEPTSRAAEVVCRERTAPPPAPRGPEPIADIATTPADPPTPTTTPDDELRESKVPAGRISRLWNLGGLAAGMMAGAVGESFSRALGRGTGNGTPSGGTQGSVMLGAENM